VRLKIGVGAGKNNGRKSAGLSFIGPLKQEKKARFDRTSGTEVTLTAHNEAETVTITAKDSVCPKTITFNIVAPSDVLMEKADSQKLHQHNRQAPDFMAGHTSSKGRIFRRPGCKVRSNHKHRYRSVELFNGPHPGDDSRAIQTW
jgi:hypothetical protein